MIYAIVADKVPSKVQTYLLRFAGEKYFQYNYKYEKGRENQSPPLLNLKMTL